MKTSVQRVALAVMLAGLVVSATACGPGAGEGLVNAYLQFAGPIVVIGVVLALLLGGGNPPS